MKVAGTRLRKARRRNIRKRGGERKQLTTGLGPVTCPKCGRKGWLQGFYLRYSVTGTVSGPYFRVAHNKPAATEYGSTDNHWVILHSKRTTRVCHLGKLSVKELDLLVRQRPWPITAEDALRRLKRFHPEEE